MKLHNRMIASCLDLDADVLRLLVNSWAKEVAQLEAEISQSHVEIDRAMDNRNVGMCTGDSKLSYRLAELVSYVKQLEVIVDELPECCDDCPMLRLIEDDLICTLLNIGLDLPDIYVSRHPDCPLELDDLPLFDKGT